MTYAFDTLGYAKRLRQAGISPEQAEAHAEAAREFVMGELVTHYDLERTRRELDTKIDGFKRVAHRITDPPSMKATSRGSRGPVRGGLSI